MGTGSTTGTYYPLGTAFANVMTSRLKDVNVMAVSTSGSLENIKLLEEKELKLAIVQSDIFYYAKEGQGDFRDGKRTQLRGLLSLYPEAVQIIVPAESDITTVEQLRGRKVILGAKGSGNLKTALSFLSVYGMQETDFTPGYLSYDAAITAIENREYDAFFLVAGLPTKVLTELSDRTEVRILTFSPKDLQKICEKLTFLSPVVIPAKTYRNQKEKIETIALRALLVTTDNLPEKIAWQLLDVIFSNLDYLKRMHPRAGDISWESYLNAIPESQLHPGSARFYQEMTKTKGK
jgi:hypothetical protein